MNGVMPQSDPDVIPAIQSQPGEVNMSIVPIIIPTGVNRDLDTPRIAHRKHHKHDRECCSTYPKAKTMFVWLFALLVIAALGFTLWLTRNIPFGTNCGNTHRALLGVLIAIVLGGIVMPLYYKYIKRDIVAKNLAREKSAMADSLTPFDAEVIRKNRKKKTSVLASDRFKFVLKLATFLLIVIVALGYYYLWSVENRCVDPNLWIVKGWFIALLGLAVIVMAFMLAAMYHAVKERYRLNTARYELDP
ncbi:hypothetical protein BGZ76_003233 [Entomortierella beljakovae]|nr:hypothetical protein BGZ76_003233 [Entomortierella beljakovae]